MKEYKLVLRFKGKKETLEFIEAVQSLIPEGSGFYEADAMDFSSGKAEKNTYILANSEDRISGTIFSID